jgi:hypothetical protein
MPSCYAPFPLFHTIQTVSLFRHISPVLIFIAQALIRAGTTSRTAGILGAISADVVKESVDKNIWIIYNGTHDGFFIVLD